MKRALDRRVEISKRLVVVNFTGSFVAQILNITVLFWLHRHLLVKISPSEYSLLPLLYAIMAFIPLATVALTGGIGRFITEAHAKGDDAEVTRICSTMFPILSVAGLVFLGAGWFFSWKIDHFLCIEPDRLWDAQIMMALLMATASLRLPASPFGVGFFVRQRFVLQNIITIGCMMFRIGLMFVLIYGVSTRVLWVVTSTVAMEFLILAITTPVSMWLVPSLRFRRSAIDWRCARTIMRFGGWQFLLVLGLTLRNALDPIVLNRFSTPWDLACYNVASLPFQHLWQTISMAKRTVNPSIIAMHAGQEKERLRSAFLRGNRMALWVFLLSGLPLALFAHPLITLYIGETLWVTPALLQINFLGFLVVVPTVVFATIVEAIGRPRDFCLLVLGTNLINLALTLFFVGGLGYGAIGSCVATTLSAAICYPLLVWPLSRSTLSITAAEWFWEVLWPGALPAVLSTPVYLVSGRLLGSDTLPGLAGALALGGVAYVTCLYVFAARPRDLEDIRRMVSLGRR